MKLGGNVDVDYINANYVTGELAGFKVRVTSRALWFGTEPNRMSGFIPKTEPVIPFNCENSLLSLLFSKDNIRLGEHFPICGSYVFILCCVRSYGTLCFYKNV